MSIARVKRHAVAFTLLEITLAVAIMGLMSLAIYRFVESNVVALRISSAQIAMDAHYGGLESLLTAQFQNLPAGQGMLLGEPFKLEGRARDEITWICDAGPGLLTQFADGQFRVHMRLRPMKIGARYELGLVRRPVEEDDSSATGAWATLLANIDAMEIRYFDPRLNVWVDRWTDGGVLPNLVRISLQHDGSTVPWVAIVPLKRTPF
jgi:type II secretory pathway pseudopilin PulG